MDLVNCGPCPIGCDIPIPVAIGTPGSCFDIPLPVPIGTPGSCFDIPLPVPIGECGGCFDDIPLPVAIGGCGCNELCIDDYFDTSCFDC